MDDKQQELINDVTGGESACCGANLYNDDICAECLEHSGPREKEEKEEEE